MNAKIRNTMFKTILISLVAVFIWSCKESVYKEDVSLAATNATEDLNTSESYKFTDDIEKPIREDLKIIKSGSVRYKITDIQKATNQIKELARRHNAYISNLRFEDNLYRKENRFTIKVPAEYFDTLMDSIGIVAEFVDFENITTKDVTEEYLDIETRLKTKREVKARLEVILKKNAKTVEDILATEERLRVLQEEIEASQGRLNYFTNKVAFSSIEIELYQTVDYKKEPLVYKKTFWNKTKEGFDFGWNFLETFVIGIFHIWPLLVIGLLIYLLRKRKFLKGKN